MTEQQPVAEIETPQKTKRIRVKLPSRSTLTKGAALAATFGLGAYVGAKRVKDACACEPDSATAEADQSTD